MAAAKAIEPALPRSNAFIVFISLMRCEERRVRIQKNPASFAFILEGTCPVTSAVLEPGSAPPCSDSVQAVTYTSDAVWLDVWLHADHWDLLEENVLSISGISQRQSRFGPARMQVER